MRPIFVFTDGAAKGNPGPAGWGAVILTPDDRVTEIGGGSRRATNNQMELTGAIEALRFLRDASGPVEMYTDSTYVIRGIREWIHGWRRRGWRTSEGTDVLNRELWETLDRLVSERGEPDRVSWHYVRGHASIPGNERADQIACAHAAGKDPALYRGPRAGCGVDLLEVPEDTNPPRARARGAARTERARPYSYLSVVDGKPMRHQTWAECERRVKGRSGARFKKASSAGDEARILDAWGYSPADLD